MWSGHDSARGPDMAFIRDLAYVYPAVLPRSVAARCVMQPDHATVTARRHDSSLVEKCRLASRKELMSTMFRDLWFGAMAYEGVHGALLLMM